MAAPQPIPARAKAGFPTRLLINPVTNSVGTTPTKILNNNPDRIFWLVINLSANDGYIGWDTLVASNRGLYLPANGGYASASIEEDGELVIYEVWAINLNAAGIYYIVEVEKI